MVGGPVGAESTAQTDALMNAQILSYSRARGVFAGVALTAGTLRPDIDATTRCTARKRQHRDRLERKVQPNEDGKKLVDLLNKYSSRRTE